MRFPFTVPKKMLPTRVFVPAGCQKCFAWQSVYQQKAERKRERVGVDVEEWSTKMDWDVKMCKMQTGRKRKLGKWIRRIDQTKALWTSARMREERRKRWMDGTDELSWKQQMQCGEIERLMDVDVLGKGWRKGDFVKSKMGPIDSMMKGEEKE